MSDANAEWRDITVKPPPLGEWILVYPPGRLSFGLPVNLAWLQPNGTSDLSSYTHWAPLPKPPLDSPPGGE